MMKSIAYIVLNFCFICGCFADEKAIDMFRPLEQTPSVAIVDNLTKPDVFAKSNNLTRKAGSFKKAIGEPLYIKGIVTDVFGVPISNARIKIWQTNAAGKYQDLLSEYDSFRDPNFIMSGEAVTDNLGRYEFITIFPGFYDDRAPHINLIVYHDKFGVIETEFYFQSHPLNDSDPIYLSYTKQERRMLTADIYYMDNNDINKGKLAIFDVVMQGIHEYKRY